DYKLVNGSVVVLNQVLFDNRPYTSIWGTGSDNLYFTSDKRKIIHWDGIKASVAFNTSGNHVGEIHGSSEDNIWASGNTEVQFSYVVHFNGEEWNTVEMPYDRLNAAAVYTLNARETFLAGNGMYFGYPGNFTEIEYPANIYIDEIDGPSSNDLFACGSFSLVMHYNGIEWKRLDPFPTEFGRLRGIYYSNNTVFIVGRGDNAAQIIIGKK
ncbi:MAG: hypothetical protein KDF60_17680, partial [Calditrichaeota bacterium]|nr:hypothetical protein [Calditrichota bacterium]